MTHVRENKRRPRRGGKKVRLAHLKFLYLENELKITPAKYPPEFIEWMHRIEDFAKILSNSNPASKDEKYKTDRAITDQLTLAVVKGLVKKAKVEKKQGNLKEFLASIGALLTEKGDQQKRIDTSDAALRLNMVEQNRPSVIAWAAQKDDLPATSCLLTPKLEPSLENSSDESTITMNGCLDQINEPS